MIMRKKCTACKQEFMAHDWLEDDFCQFCAIEFENELIDEANARSAKAHNKLQYALTDQVDIK